MMNTKLSLAFNALIFLSVTFTIVYFYFIRPLNDERAPIRWKIFRFFTTDSNVLCALAALAVAVLDIRALATGTVDIPEWAVVLKYAGTVSVTITFLTVMVFLGPTQGYGKMLLRDGFFLHVFAPILAMISFLAFDEGCGIAKRNIYYGALPVFIYAAVYVVMVVGKGENRGGWKDFYGFNKGGRWGMSLAVMLAGALIVSMLMRMMRNAWL